MWRRHWEPQPFSYPQWHHVQQDQPRSRARIRLVLHELITRRCTSDHHKEAFPYFHPLLLTVCSLTALWATRDAVLLAQQRDRKKPASATPSSHCNQNWNTDRALSMCALTWTNSWKPPTSKQLPSTAAVEVTKRVNLSLQHHLFYHQDTPKNRAVLIICTLHD